MSDEFKGAVNTLKSAAKIAGIEGKDIEILENPNRIVNVNFPVKLSDDSTKIFSGFRVQHNNALGPFKGGIRFHQEVDIEEVKALAFWMAIKCATVNIPMGGGKGGVTFNPKDYSENDIERITRAFIRSIADFIGSDKDIPAPDVYTNPRIMAIMLDEYEKIIGKKDTAAFTGKDIKDGGIAMRAYSTSMGGAFILRKIIEDSGKKPEQVSVAIQGMGNAGSNMAKILSDWGFKIIAVSDSKGGTFNEKGIDIKAVLDHKKKTRSVIDFAEGTNISNDELLVTEADILVPSALSCSIGPHNIHKIKAKIIIELANGPICNVPEEKIHGSDIIVVPDVLANAGGVVGSYFEWRDNKAGKQPDEKQEVEELRKIMLDAYVGVKAVAEKHSTTLRNACYIMAAKRIIEAENERTGA